MKSLKKFAGHHGRHFSLRHSGERLVIHGPDLGVAGFLDRDGTLVVLSPKYHEALKEVCEYLQEHGIHIKQKKEELE